MYSINLFWPKTFMKIYKKSEYFCCPWLFNHLSWDKLSLELDLLQPPYWMLAVNSCKIADMVFNNYHSHIECCNATTAVETYKQIIVHTST